MAPGSQAPRLATSSSPEEWLCQGRTLFEQRRYPQAKHCFEKARRPNYVIMAEAYILRDDAEAKDGRDRKRAFQEAAKAFRACSERFGRRRSDYLRLSANCSYRAGDIEVAAETYEEGGIFDDAVVCYRELRMFDKAVEIVKDGKVKSTSLVDSIIRVARLFYFSEVQSLPPSDPRRAVRLAQGTRLFETSEEALEYAEERDLDIARGDILVAHLRLSEAAELHWSEGRPMEAIDLFLKEGSSESVGRASQCIIEELWQRISFAVRRDAVCADAITLRLLGLGQSIKMDEKNRKELAMFNSILSTSIPVTAYCEQGRSFLLDQNLAAAILCFENYFSAFTTLQDRNIPLKAIVEELELFLQYITLLISELKAFPSESNNVLSKLFGFRSISNDQMLLSPGSFLSSHCDEALTTEGIALSPVKLSLLLKSSVMGHLQWQMEQENELCKNIKAFSLCLPFSVAGICSRPSCTKAHIGGRNLTAVYYTLRVRVHLQQVLLFRQFPFEPSKYSHSRRRFWLRRLYEAVFPPHPVMGNMSCFDIQNVPEMQGNAMVDIKYWILGFIYSHRLLPLPPFLTLLSYGTALLITAAPSFLTLKESGILSTYSNDARYVYRGQWKWAKFPQEYRRESGTVVYDLLSAFQGTAPNSLTKGILCLRHIILRKLDIDISLLCDFIEYLCRNLIFSAACHYNGALTLHNVMFPRSWLLSVMDVENFRARDFNFLTLLIGPIAELLTRIHTGVEAEHLQYETITLAHNIYNGNIVRSTFITRICRAFALFGYNYHNGTIRQAIFYALTALRDCDPPPPPSAPWSRYAFAEDWSAIAKIVRNSANSNPTDEMVHLLHASRLPASPPPNFANVRYIVYNRLDELPHLLRRQDTPLQHPLTAMSTDLDENDAENMETEDAHVHMEDGDDTQHAAAPDEDPNIMSAEEREQEKRVLSRLPSIYRENRWRRQGSQTRMAERRNEFFLSCLKVARDIPSGRYRKMALGPLPHVLSSLQAIYELMHDFKRKTKDWMKQPLDHEELDRLDQQLTQTNSAIKKIVSLRDSLGPESSIHLTYDSNALKRHVSQLNALASEGLPISLPEDVREELAIGWKGIVKAKVVRKREKPTLNTEDIFEKF
ncbi:hypothetical protein WG66_015967 [Moniliophthora roreri]|uniref:Uncharacterized protein n=1 Tax=Moniliophthora roreri TaxID=221103 RepID=A0A0W0G8X0_MONRR|nr:hypothetical protein WG66_015967 [Moniliophthora roreri]